MDVSTILLQLYDTNLEISEKKYKECKIKLHVINAKPNIYKIRYTYIVISHENSLNYYIYIYYSNIQDITQLNIQSNNYELAKFVLR